MSETPRNRSNLAIIIPAYKATFLPAALDSIAAQTFKDFTVYVGDDSSPYDIAGIVDVYRDRINLVYQRFESNLGGKDLVAQWERCIAMSQDEPYIWLFSDDDVMEPNCVAELFRQIDNTNGAYDLYHFDVKEMNAEGEVTKLLPAFPPVLSAYDYYKGKSSGKYRSYVVENVFSRKVYEEKGGFKNFDLAWGSDVATWCMFCGKKGMFKLLNAHVCWRRSKENITPDKSRWIAERKLMARCASLNWAYDYFKDETDIWHTNRQIFVRVMRRYKKLVGQKCQNKAYGFFFEEHGHGNEKPLIWLLVSLPKPIYNLTQKNF